MHKVLALIDVLKNKLRINMFKDDGEIFEKIQTDNKNKILQSEKDKVITNLNKLEKKDFKHFIPLFEKIAEIIKFDLISS